MWGSAHLTVEGGGQGLGSQETQETLAKPQPTSAHHCGSVIYSICSVKVGLTLPNSLEVL